MRELERNFPHSSTPLPASTPGLSIIGRGRLGSALAAALGTGAALGRGEAPPAACEAVLLCVPHEEISAAAGAVAGAARLVGHASRATPLSALLPSRAELFALHPLQTVTGS